MSEGRVVCHGHLVFILALVVRGIGSVYECLQQSP